MLNQLEEEINPCEELIKQQEGVPECSLMKEGYHAQKKKYYFCICDPDCQEPLCISCLEKCHSLHWGSKTLDEFQTDSRNALCHCGQRNHYLLEDNSRSEFVYSEQCLFMEWSNTSKSYVYYEKSPNDNLCMFCYNFCSKSQEQYTKRENRDRCMAIACSCKHPDYLNVFGKIDLLIREKPFSFESFTEMQFINMIIMSEKSFENSFHRMKRSLDDLETGLVRLKKKDFEFTVFTNNSPFMKALEKLDNILGIAKALFYSKDIIDCYPYIYNCLDRTFIYTNQDNIWLLKKSLFNIFHKLNYRKDFEGLPIFDVKDLSNLNPFQRIMYSEYIKSKPDLISKYLSPDLGTKKNYVDQLLRILEKYKNIKSKNANAYEILRKIYSQCKKLVRFNTFTIEQSMKFYSLNDEIIYNSINNKDIKMSTGIEQMRMLSQIVKCILYMAYYYNDSIIKMYLNNDILLSHVSFFHSNNEIAKMIYKNCVHILLYCRTVQQICCNKDADTIKITIDNVKQSSHNSELSGYDNHTSNANLIMTKIEKFHNKIMFIATDITALTLNYPDAYLFGLRRLIGNSQEISYGYLKNVFTLKESSILSDLNYMYNDLEAQYQKFFEFEIDADELEGHVIETIKKFFELIGEPNYDSIYSTNEKRTNESTKLRHRKKSVLLPNNIHSKLAQKTENEKYRILLNKSPFLFSLIKSLKIILTIKSCQNTAGSKEYIDQIFRFLFYYIEENADNCLIILTNQILKTMRMLTDDIPYFINLLEYGITIIMKNNISLSQNNELMKVLEELVQRVSGKSMYIESFYILLKLIEKLSKMNYLHEEHTMNKIRKTMKNIYHQNPILNTFKGILIASGKTKPLLSELLEEESMIETYPLKTILKLFTKFLKIINYLFDGNSTFNEVDFLKSIFRKNQIHLILEDITLNIPLRIELLKLFRIGYIDALIETTKLNEYVHILSSDVKNEVDSNAANFNFFQDLLKIKDDKLDMNIDSSVLNFELKHFSSIVKSDKSVSRKKILNYFEEGIILPLHVFINKYISIIYNLDGIQYIKLYEIVLHFLELKKYLLEDNDAAEQEIRDEPNLLKNIALEKNNKLSLIIKKISDEERKTLIDDINDLKNKSIEILNYKKLFAYFVSHVNGFVSTPPSKYLKDIFSKKNKIYTEEDIYCLRMIYEKKGLLKTEYSEKAFQIRLKYENDKTKLIDSSLSQNLAEKNVLYDATYRSIMLRPMFYLINSETLYLKYRRQNLWQIFRLLQYDTNGSQDDILALRKSERDLEKLPKTPNQIAFDGDSSNMKDVQKPTVDLKYLTDLFVQNLLSIIFGSCNPSITSQNEDYTIAYMVIKIMKYMCEDHNTKFQTIFFKDIKINAKNNTTLNMFELMMCALSKIVLLSKWTQQGDNFDENANSYLYEIFFCMIEFAIEMVQGTTKNNLIRIIQTKHRKEEKSYFFKFLKSVKDIVINNSNNSEIVYNVRLDVLNFITAFVEEKSTPEKIIVLLSNLYNPVAIFDSIVIILKKLYLKITNQTTNGLLGKIELNQEICQLFIDEYFSVSEFSNYQEFELANRMYNYVKQLTTYGIKEAKNIIDSINLYTEKELNELRTKQFEGEKEKFNKDNVMIDPKYCQNYYAVKFFESITRTVYIQGEEKQTQMVLFTLNPTVLFLSENTKNDFCQNTPRDSRSSKLFALMEYTSYFFIEINHNKKRFAGNIFLKILNKINYRIVEALMFILTVAINIIIFVSIQNDDETTDYTRVYKWIFYPNIVQVALNAIFLLFWIVSKFSLYFVIEKEKYYIRNRKNKDIPLGFFEYVQIIIFHTLLTKKEIISFAWNLIFSITSLCSSKNLFVFSIQLFLAINLSRTLRNLALAITMRYQQILTSLMFLFVAVYVFSTLAFFLLSKDFVVTVEDNQENGCGSLLYCFFTHMEFGLRTDGGIGEYIRKLSFGDSPGYFMGMFFYQFVFFVVIIIIMLAVIGGSVIDTFAELRERSQGDLHDMMDVCFICNATRDEIEKQGEKFEDHITKVHHIWTYVDYMIGLKYVDPQETNAINSFVIEKIEEKKISWFPSFNSNEDANEEEEE